MLLAAGAGSQERFDLSVASIGFPTVEYQPEAWRINALKLFEGRLYVGYGDYGANTGPTDVIGYDFSTSGFVKEYTVQEEAITQFQTIGGKLVIPGVDATEAWDSGNVYVKSDDGWSKYRSVPYGLHVFDVAPYGGKWFVGTGNYCKLTREDEFAPGAILSTSDSCRTWRYEYLSPSDRQAIYRFSALVPFKGKLYAFPYAYAWMTLSDMPERFRQYLSEPLWNEGKEGYLVSVDRALGGSEAIVYDGSAWRQSDMIPGDGVYKIRPVVFGDKLLLSVASGEYINSPNMYLSKHGRLPDNVSTSLYAHDGDTAEKLDFRYEMIRDVIVVRDSLYILYHDHGRELIAATADLKHWSTYRLPLGLKDPLSLERHGDEFFIGMADGNIFRSTECRPSAETGSGELVPASFHGAAETPRKSLRYWAAVTGWIKPGRQARYSCSLEPGNSITAKTENVSELRIYVPDCLAGRGLPVSLTIDGQPVYTGKYRSELVCRRSRDRWSVRGGEGTAAAFKPPRVILGRAAVGLFRTGDDPAPGRWQAEVFRWATMADIGLTNQGAVRRDIPKGDITLEDVYDLNYRNDIRVFRAKGANLLEMLSHNIRQKRDRCQGAGFTADFVIGEDLSKNDILATSLDTGRVYTVATSSYVIERAKDILGREVEACEVGMSVAEATAAWLLKNKTIKAAPAAFTYRDAR
jgi:hypothetical protein